MNIQSYERITERIVTLLEQGTVPWHKPWKVNTGLPRNLISKKPYRGINVFLLMAMSYESPHWLTFRQAIQLGGNVKKGEKACPVVFWKKMEIEDKKSGEPQKKPLLRLYHVFNAAQCEGLKASWKGHVPERREMGQPQQQAVPPPGYPWEYQRLVTLDDGRRMLIRASLASSGVAASR